MKLAITSEWVFEEEAASFFDMIECTCAVACINCRSSGLHLLAWASAWALKGSDEGLLWGALLSVSAASCSEFSRGGPFCFCGGPACFWGPNAGLAAPACCCFCAYRRCRELSWEVFCILFKQLAQMVKIASKHLVLGIFWHLNASYWK